jgi:hypothetical protein
MSKHNMDNRQLAQAIGAGDSTVHGWLEQDAQPSVRMIVLMSRVFAVSTDTILKLVGYDTVVSNDEGERAARRAELLARLPRFAEIAEKIARLSPEKQDAYLSVIERLLPTE